MTAERARAMDQETLPLSRVQILGLAVAAVGCVLVALYPVLDPGTMEPGLSWPVEGEPRRPAPQDPRLSLASGLVGPGLLVWGTAAARSGSLAPLTVRSALLAPALGTAALAVGVGRFVYGTVRVTPVRLDTDTGDERVYDPSVAEALDIAHADGMLMVLAVCAALPVGVAVARRGRRGVAPLTLPVGLIAARVVWGAARGSPPSWSLFDVLFLVAALTLPFALGYCAARDVDARAGKRPEPDGVGGARG